MFQQKIDQTPFTVGDVNDFFSETIRELNGGADKTIISTLRALLYQRIGSDTLSVQYTSSRYSAADVDSTTAKDLVSYMLNENPSRSHNKLFIHGINGESVDRNACFKLIKQRFTRAFSGFERVQKVTDFFRKSFVVVCYVNPASKTTVIFIDKITVRKFHAIQSAAFAFLPWYFDPTQGVTKHEMDLVQSLQEKTPDKYNEVLARIISAIDIRGTLIRRNLEGFEKRYDERAIATLESEIEVENDQINRWMRDIANKSRSVNDKMLRINTLRERRDNTESEVMEYFLRNKNLDFIKTRNEAITFNVRGQLIYFDEELASRCIERGTSYVYEYISGNLTKAGVKKLMKAIFVDQELFINVCSTFVLDLSDGVSAPSGHNYDSSVYGDYTPNPHLYHFSCLGSNSSLIAQHIRDGNLIGAIEQCCAANSSLNFNDGAVMGRFMRTLFGSSDRLNKKCIQLPTGDVVKPEEAIEWLNKREQEEATDEQKD